MAKTMDKEFVSYEIALALKELGFDEPCLAYYNDVELQTPHLSVGRGVKTLSDMQGGYYKLAPLSQQVFRWFREKYQLECISERSGRWLWYKFEIYELYKDCKLMRCTKLEFTTYEEAENACIDKLIEIAKQQDNGMESNN
jgi:hypothetical protein